MLKKGPYYYETILDLPFAKAVERVKEALAREGFGVLTEINVSATLKKKLDKDFRPYLILGACHPPSAHRALQAEPHIGLLMPCNVVVQEGPGGKTTVSAVNPEMSMRVVDNDRVVPMACEVAQKLRGVIGWL